MKNSFAPSLLCPTRWGSPQSRLIAVMSFESGQAASDATGGITLHSLEAVERRWCDPQNPADRPDTKDATVSQREGSAGRRDKSCQAGIVMQQIGPERKFCSHLGHFGVHKLPVFPGCREKGLLAVQLS
ncbi:hypothetical protein [Paracoccus mutanolyticus]|uniref:hypothetical protein n=1 Tax=Paracoccus mutanolyticus TaxID=1499308 RepID=UPI0011AE2396|nr:hypothetical protein [Paracoccus mutanolyticus]